MGGYYSRGDLADFRSGIRLNDYPASDDPHPVFGFSQHLNFILMGISDMETFTPAPLNPVPETTRLIPVMTTVSTAVTTVAPTIEEMPVTSGIFRLSPYWCSVRLRSREFLSGEGGDNPGLQNKSNLLFCLFFFLSK